MASKDISTVDYTDSFNTFFVKDVDDIRQVNKDNVKNVLGIGVVTGAIAEADSTLTLTDSIEKPFELHLYGKSTQDGTPTPDNPVEVASVENPTVKANGKNLVDFENLTNCTGNGALWIKQNVTYNDLTVRKRQGIWTGLTFEFPMKKGEQITISTWLRRENASEGAVYLYGNTNCDISGIIVFSGNSDWVYFSKVITCIKDGNQAMRFEQSTPGYLYMAGLQFEKGTQATPYVPYKVQSQQFNYALNGIGDVKDELIIYADGTGKLIQRIDSKISTQTTTADHSDCILSEPIITEISAEQMKSYYPVTNIFTDQSAGIKAVYTADTKGYIDRKFDELATALVAQTSEQ